MASVIMTHFTISTLPSVPSEVHARAMSENLTIRPVKLSYEQILKKMEKIGDGWHLRREHTEDKKRENSQAKLESDKTHTWLFMRGDEEIGFCVAVKGGFDESLADKFNLAANKTEIYKIGLYPEYTNQGYGQVFLPSVQVALLNGQKASTSVSVGELEPSDEIYLNTRSSNNVDSRNFYEQHGYEAVGKDVWIEKSADEKSNQKLDYTIVETSSLSNDHFDKVVTEFPAAKKKRPLTPASALPLVFSALK